MKMYIYVHIQSQYSRMHDPNEFDVLSDIGLGFEKYKTER